MKVGQKKNRLRVFASYSTLYSFPYDACLQVLESENAVAVLTKVDVPTMADGVSPPLLEIFSAEFISESTDCI
jgi:hypothetical protein